MTLVRSASDSTWRNYMKPNEFFPNRLSYDFIYHNIGYSNADQGYITTDDSENSGRTSSTQVRSLSFSGSIEKNMNEIRERRNSDGGRMRQRSMDTERPYARIGNGGRSMKIQFARQNIYNYPM